MPPSHRSRVRQRTANNNGHGSRTSAAAAAAAAALSALLLAAPTTHAYLGPTHCTKPGISAAAVVQSTPLGYSTFNHLLFDMVSLANSFKSGQHFPDEQLLFKICPGTIIDLDDTSLPLGFLPIEVPRLTLQCGDNGRRSSDPSEACIIRGGGKRNPNSKEWNTVPQRAYKNSASGILGGGHGSVAQIYVYGESAYEITLKGITFDNSLSEIEMDMYDEYVSQFGKGSFVVDDDAVMNNMNGNGRDEEKIEQEYDASVPSSTSSNNNWSGADQLMEDGKSNNNVRRRNRNLQGEQSQNGGGGTTGGDGDVGAQPAHRFASIVVRGKGYGDDAGPRLITIEDCRFEYHRGYAVLVSPGIQQPEMPMAPEFKMPSKDRQQKPPSPGVDNLNNQSSGQIHNGSFGSKQDDADGKKTVITPLPQDDGNNGQGRKLNLLDNGEKYIPRDGLVSYYDNTAGRNYHDGRRVKISKTEFANNVVSGENVAGLVTSAYSLTLTDCFFRKNNAKAMVFVYNNEALVDNTIFADNTVEVSTVIMASPRGSKPIVAQTKLGEKLAVVEPLHIVERTCFLGSHVGMSNVLVTDVDKTGFGQRDNHATKTEFTWVSKCEGGAAEKLGNDCLETGRCDGTCVQFTSPRCLAERGDSKEFEAFFNAGSGRYGVAGNVRWVSLRLTLGLAVVLGVGVLF